MRVRGYSALALELHGRSSALADRDTPVSLSLVVEPQCLGFSPNASIHNKKACARQAFLLW